MPRHVRLHRSPHGRLQEVTPRAPPVLAYLHVCTYADRRLENEAQNQHPPWAFRRSESAVTSHPGSANPCHRPEKSPPLCAVAAALPQHPLCSVGLLHFFTKTVSRGTHNELTFPVGDRAMCAREPHTSNRTRAPSTPNRDQATGRFSRVTVDAQAVGDVAAHYWATMAAQPPPYGCNAVQLCTPSLTSGRNTCTIAETSGGHQEASMHTATLSPAKDGGARRRRPTLSEPETAASASQVLTFTAFPRPSPSSPSHTHGVRPTGTVSVGRHVTTASRTLRMSSRIKATAESQEGPT